MRLRTPLLAAALLAAALPLAAQTQPQPAPGSAEMFAFLSGRWGCAGEFASGRKLEADLAFTPQLDGKWLEFRHTDRAPGRYQAISHWGTDPATGTMVSLMFDIGGGVRLFTAAEGWKDRAVAFETAQLMAPPRGRERFTYRAESAATLRVTWEVNRDGAWRMGDWLLCTKQG
ncbi:hypothetical protein [Longimicrobium sp.]|uniref:hypothetical protein n=1 Tax=Longimicrobium sp. TaxID=2029185 RepID=UPI002BE93162|nr:hypothetical protein [Longimicrobium sp.]HSU16521.1 hypothetical protein [Longimicrobium sp.]